MKKLFTEKQIGLAAFFAGPIPPGILFYLNYKRIKKEKEAYIAMAATLIFTMGMFFTIFQLPEKVVDKIPDSVFSAFYGLLVYGVYKFFLSKEIEHRLNEGAEKASNWSVVAVSILGFVITLVIILGLAVNQPPFEGDKMTFGASKDEIYYDKEKTSPEDVRKLANVLIESGYFGGEAPSAVHLEKTSQQCEVTLSVDKSYWTDPAVKEFVSLLKQELGAQYHVDVTIILEHYELSGKRSEMRV